MQLVNATPHTVTIVSKDGSVLLTLPKGEFELRCAEQRLESAPVVVDGVAVPTSSVTYGAVYRSDGGEVPPVVEGVAYVVSALVRQAAPERTDFYSPGPLVRDADGRPVGCLGLTR